MTENDVYFREKCSDFVENIKYFHYHKFTRVQTVDVDLMRFKA